jgi:hypothetical protein
MGSSVSDIVSPSRQAQLGVSDQDQIHRFSDSPTELAQRLTVHPSTIKSWTKAGILNSHKANDKNERLYQPPIAGDPRLTVRQGSPLRRRVLTQPTTGGAL